jgi:hypothetical protein
MYLIISIRSDEGILASSLTHGDTTFSEKRYKVLFRGIITAKKADNISINRFTLLIERNCKFYTASTIGYKDDLQLFQNLHYFQLDNYLPLYEEILALKNSTELVKSMVIARNIIEYIQGDNSIKSCIPSIQHGLLACQP